MRFEVSDALLCLIRPQTLLSLVIAASVWFHALTELSSLSGSGSGVRLALNCVSGSSGTELLRYLEYAAN
jgi:hypothetical protein